MKDYYAILGLDSDASTDTIKAAYRHLAREAHPDRKSHLGRDAQLGSSSRMAELNEAHAVLSNPARKKEYDEEVRREEAERERREEAAAHGAAPPPSPVPVPGAAAEPQAPQPLRTRPRAGGGVASSVVQHYASQLQQVLLAKKEEFPWRPLKLEGFDWALESDFWVSHYIVTFRGFAIADPEATRKFTNYAQFAIDRSRKLLKQNFFLFLFGFQRIVEFEQVLAQLRRFSGGASERSLILLLDVAHGRSVPCGPRIQDSRYTTLLSRIGVSGS